MEGETGRVGSIIIGIGVNVNQHREEFPEEIRDIATSLAEGLGHPVSRAALAAAMVEELDKLRDALDGVADGSAPAAREELREAVRQQAATEYLTAYRQLDITAGSDVMVLAADGARSAKALSINGDFSLEVKYPDGSRESLSSGEVSLRIAGTGHE